MGAVVTSGLTKWYGSVRAVSEVDLKVEAGEVRGLLGPNGAGKTTLLRMLLGLVRPDGGTIEILGRRLERWDSWVSTGVAGFVESPSFYPYLSGRANLEVLAEFDSEGSGAQITDALEQVDLAARGGDRVSGYSSGMRQRLGIAAALLRSPQLLILDEPTAGLDPAGVRLVRKLVQALSARCVTVLLSSHQIGDIEGVCDSLSVLSGGQPVWQGSITRMLAEAPPSAYRLVTNDDSRAFALANYQRGIRAERSPVDGLTIEADLSALDLFIIALGRANVAVRRLELSMRPLESMFFELTDARPDSS